MVDAADAFSEEPSIPPHLTSSKPLHDHSFLKNKQFSAKAHLYPIDESEDFHDPFSDLSLFLSRKIKSEIQKHGSMGQWSSKIEASLLAGILPEFKSKFPKYRLGVCAIKKVWQKVCYYYGKVEPHREAIKEDGKLNIEFMIKENLKGYSQQQSACLPPYHTAHQIAVKLSECIAALDGTKPCLEHLTKTIWAVQKHLLAHLSIKDSKQVFDDYDQYDKLIVKFLLEITSKSQNIPQPELQVQIKNKIDDLKNISKSYSLENSYVIVCVLLAQKIYSHLDFHRLCQEDGKKALFAFLKKQIQLMKNFNLSPLEACQRILALYPLKECIPKHFSEEKIKKVIKELYQGSKPSIQSDGLCAFIQAELHFLKRKEVFSQYQKIETFIMQTLSAISDLPKWKEEFSDELETIFWFAYPYDIKQVPPAHLEFYKQQVLEALFDTQVFSLKKNLYLIIESLKKYKQLLVKETSSQAPSLEELLEKKIYLWSIQNDMVSRWIHFDPSHPLLKTIEKCYKTKENSATHEKFIEDVFYHIIKTEPQKQQDAYLLRNRLTIFYKYFWYHQLTESEESSLDRMIAYQSHDIKITHQDKGAEDQKTILEFRLSKILPLTPVSKKLLEKHLD